MTGFSASWRLFVFGVRQRGMKGQTAQTQVVRTILCGGNAQLGKGSAIVVAVAACSMGGFMVPVVQGRIGLAVERHTWSWAESAQGVDA
jgi:hypothetical protein